MVETNWGSNTKRSSLGDVDLTGISVSFLFKFCSRNSFSLYQRLVQRVFSRSNRNIISRTVDLRNLCGGSAVPARMTNYLFIQSDTNNISVHFLC